MFNVKHNECVGFESRWKVKKVSSQSSTHTTDFSTSEMATNTSNSNTTDTQTDCGQPPPNSDVDYDKLSEWLKRIYPKVKKELDETANSRAFRGYRLSSDVTDANCKLLQTLNIISAPAGGGDENINLSSIVSALSWNCTGKSLAVSCKSSHNSWCYHEGSVEIYTLTRDDLLPESPKIRIKTESCVLILQFHPNSPSLIAGGLFSGNIIIWNIQSDEEEIVAKVNGHGEGVTQLSWVVDINSAKNILLASSGLDGVLKLWNFIPSEFLLSPKERYKFKTPILGNMPKSSKTSEESEHDTDVDKKIVRGVTCFDFSKHVLDMFVVGAEGGLVIQCSVLGTSKLKGSTAEEPLLDAVCKYYQPHKGEVTSIRFSPNRKEMFMTSGSDSEIRIYLIGQEEPAQVIFLKRLLNTISWVPFEDKVIAGCGERGLIEVFNLKEGKPIEITLKEKVAVNNLTQMKINGNKSCLVIVGNDKGFLQLWKVPWTPLAAISL